MQAKFAKELTRMRALVEKEAEVPLRVFVERETSPRSYKFYLNNIALHSASYPMIVIMSATLSMMIDMYW